MAPRSSKQFEEMRLSRKETLVNAAMELFASNGFAGTSISSIAKKAEVSKGLVYNYFENKEALVREIVMEGIQEVMKEMDFDLSQKMTRELMIDMLDKNLNLIQNNSAYWKLYIAVIAQPAVIELVKDEIFKLMGTYFMAIAQYYEEKGAKNPLAYAYLLGAIFDGIGLDSLYDPENYPFKEIREIIIEKLI
ncbi:MAG: TetR/AcrR family transcriptional regulator [Bacteroidales bacterium]|nr:TetR/AcrR family transcriptional regulator [Bacteroidales bacterium]